MDRWIQKSFFLSLLFFSPSLNLFLFVSNSSISNFILDHSTLFLRYTSFSHISFTLFFSHAIFILSFSHISFILSFFILFFLFLFLIFLSFFFTEKFSFLYIFSLFLFLAQFHFAFFKLFFCFFLPFILDHIIWLSSFSFSQRKIKQQYKPKLIILQLTH